MLLPIDGRKLCLHKEKLVVDRASEERRMVNGNRKKHPEKLSRSNGWRGSRLIVGYVSLSLARSGCQRPAKRSRVGDRTQKKTSLVGVAPRRFWLLEPEASHGQNPLGLFYGQPSTILT